MWLMLQQDEPDDYVIATGRTHSVAEFLELAFSHLDLDYRAYLAVDPSFYRPAEDVALKGDAGKAREKLNWRCTIDLEQLVTEMVEHDLTQFDKHTAY